MNIFQIRYISLKSGSSWQRGSVWR